MLTLRYNEHVFILMLRERVGCLEIQPPIMVNGYKARVLFFFFCNSQSLHFSNPPTCRYYTNPRNWTTNFP